MQNPFQKKILPFLTVLIFLTIACSHSTTTPPVSSSDIPQETQQTLKTAMEAIKKYQLTQIPIECLSFEEQNSAKSVEYFVREIHNKKCGGVEGTAPGLFTIQIDKKTGKISSDAKNVEGEMQVLN